MDTFSYDNCKTRPFKTQPQYLNGTLNTLNFVVRIRNTLSLWSSQRVKHCWFLQNKTLTVLQNSTLGDYTQFPLTTLVYDYRFFLGLLLQTLGRFLSVFQFVDNKVFLILIFCCLGRTLCVYEVYLFNTYLKFDVFNKVIKNYMKYFNLYLLVYNSKVLTICGI